MNKKAVTRMQAIVLAAIILVSAIVVTYVVTIQTNPGQRVVRLNIITEYTSGSLKEAIDLVIQNFNNANPDIVVTHQPMDHLSLNNVLPIWLSGEAAPDLHMWFGGTRTKELVDLDYLVDWTDEFNEVKDDFPDSVQKGHILVDDKAYSVPIAVHTYGLYYMTGIFDTYNVQPPQTWQELIEACEMIKTGSNGEVDPFITPAKFPWLPDLQFTAILSQSVSSEFFTGLITGTESWQDPQVLNAFEKYAELVPYLPSDYKEQAEFEASQSLASGKVAMDISGPWRSGMLIDAGQTPLTDFDWVPTPEILSQYTTTMPTHSDVIVANSHTLYPEECKKFLAYAASREAQEIFAQKGNMIAGNANIDLTIYNPVQKKIYDYMQTTTDVVVEVSLAVRQEITNSWFNLMAEFLEYPENYVDIAARLDQIPWAPS